MAADPVLQTGPHHEPIAAGFKRLAAHRAVERLWAKDASLWATDPAAQAAIRDRLGWLTISRVMRGRLGAIRQAAQEIRAAGFRRAVLLGMGGSSLFSEVCRRVFGAGQGCVDLEVLDTTDPAAILAAAQRGPLEQLLAIISSKSGATSEVDALSRYFRDAFATLPGQPGARCVVITDRGTPLEARAREWKCRWVFAHGPESGSDVGGRFSALTCFGLVPAGLLGLDLERLLDRAEAMAARCGPSVPVHENPAAELAVLLCEFAAAGRNALALYGAPVLASFGSWAEQLVAESTGKSGKGILPVVGEPLRDPATYAADRVIVEIQLAGDLDGSVRRHVDALARHGHPVLRIEWQDLYDLGGEVMRWALATSLAGHLLELNPFDEPDVQESKDRTTALLKAYAQDGRLPEEPPMLTQDGIRARWTGQQADSLTQLVREFSGALGEGEFVAVLSFLPRADALDAALQTLRGQLAQRLRVATSLNLGPRYLHSTGQFFKGGPGNGIFLLLTAEDAQPLPIPGLPYSFGILKRAQALGDFEAMRQRGRRVLHLHLGDDPERVLKRLLEVVDANLLVRSNSNRDPLRARP